MTDKQQDMLHDISIADMCSVISSREQGYNDDIRRLRKENAELKESIKYVNTICERKSVTNSQLTELAADSSAKLCEAKGILKRLLEEEKNNMYWEMNGSDKSSYYKVRKEAEQFLKEVDK